MAVKIFCIMIYMCGQSFCIKCCKYNYCYEITIMTYKCAHRHKELSCMLLLCHLEYAQKYIVLYKHVVWSHSVERMLISTYDVKQTWNMHLQLQNRCIIDVHYLYTICFSKLKQIFFKLFCSSLNELWTKLISFISHYNKS